MQLRRLRGRPHRLVSAVVAFRGGSRVWHDVDSATLTLRPFSDTFLERYLDAAGDEILGCVGAYQLEGLGAQLMATGRGRPRHGARDAAPAAAAVPARPGCARDVILLGLTGSIAMGKSRAADRFRAFGVPVFDSDAQVHVMFAPGGEAVAPVAAAFPGCLGSAGGIDRNVLGQAVLGRPDELRRLEAIVHPLVRASQARFLRRACRAGARAGRPRRAAPARDRRRPARRRRGRGLGEPDAAGAARPAPAGHDRGQARQHPRRAAAGLAEEEARRLRHPVGLRRRRAGRSRRPR